jgi:hypothetical protein
MKKYKVKLAFPFYENRVMDVFSPDTEISQDRLIELGYTYNDILKLVESGFIAEHSVKQYLYTGEYRKPKDGEWFISNGRTILRAPCDYATAESYILTELPLLFSIEQIEKVLNDYIRRQGCREVFSLSVPDFLEELKRL